MLGAPMAIKYREYAEIDVVTANLKGKTAHIVNILVNLCIMVFSAVAAKQAFTLFKNGFRSVSSSLQLGMWIFYFVPVGIFALTCLYAFGKIGSEIKMMGEGEK